jgi:hypothetical protein
LVMYWRVLLWLSCTYFVRCSSVSYSTHRFQHHAYVDWVWALITLYVVTSFYPCTCTCGGVSELWGLPRSW